MVAVSTIKFEKYLCHAHAGGATATIQRGTQVKKGSYR